MVLEKKIIATNYVAHAVVKVSPVTKATSAVKKPVTNKPVMKANRASIERHVKKTYVKKSVKKDPVKKTTAKDAPDNKTPGKKSPVMLDAAVVVDVSRSLASTAAAALLLLSANVTLTPADVCCVAVTGLGSDYTAPDDDTVPIHSKSENDDDEEDVDNDDKDVAVQGGVMTPPTQLAMSITRLVVASLSPVLSHVLSQELTDMGVSLAKPLSPGSAWIGEILESLGTSDA
jgi:hypothetical protein